MRARESPLGLGGKEGAYREVNGLSRVSEKVSDGELLNDSTPSVNKLVYSSLAGDGEKVGIGPSCAGPKPTVPLPCLNSNNSIESVQNLWQETTLSKLIKRSIDSRNKARKLGKEDADGRRKESLDGYGDVWLGGLTSTEKRSGFALSVNLAWLAKTYSLERLGFLTLTFVENLTDPKKAQSKFNSLATNYLRKVFDEYICVVECQSRGAIHYHLLVVCKEDIRTGFNFDEAKLGKYSSASFYLRSLWKDLRERMPLYGFGRSELLPVKSTLSGITNYVGKYLTKASAFRGAHMKGARLIRYSHGWRVANQRFGWVSPGAACWRDRVGKFANATGCEDYGDLKRKHGRYWAKRLACAMEAVSVSELEGGCTFDDFIDNLAHVWGQNKKA